MQEEQQGMVRCILMLHSPRLSPCTAPATQTSILGAYVSVRLEVCMSVRFWAPNRRWWRPNVPLAARESPPAGSAAAASDLEVPMPNQSKIWEPRQHIQALMFPVCWSDWHEKQNGNTRKIDRDQIYRLSSGWVSASVHGEFNFTTAQTTRRQCKCTSGKGQTENAWTSITETVQSVIFLLQMKSGHLHALPDVWRESNNDCIMLC